MHFWTAYAILVLGVATNAWSSSTAAHHSSVSDLFAPFINVSILVGVLAWKLKGPLKDYFDKRAEEVANTLERASLKSKEAQILIENEERKIANFSKEIKNLNTQSENDVLAFEKKLAKETEEKTSKLKVDAESRIKADKKSMLDELNNELVNQVIAKTKSTIKTNKENQTKVSTKLLQGL